MEEWRPIFNNYEVSNTGRVRSTKFPWREDKAQHFDKDGYLQCALYWNQQQKTLKIHQLVALAFLGERPDGLVIDHIDRNKTNNRADNLRYVTQKENVRNKDKLFYFADDPELCKERARERAREWNRRKTVSIVLDKIISNIIE